MNIVIQANACFRDADQSRKRYIVLKGSAGSGKSVDTAVRRSIQKILVYKQLKHVAGMQVKS